MPKPKKPTRTFEAQAGSPLDGVRLVQQRQARPAPGENSSLPAGEGQAPAKAAGPESELVEKLIHFIKSI